MFKILRSKKGFTIVELVSVLLLLSFGALALANLFTLAFRAFDKSVERYEKQEAAKMVAQYLQSGGAGLGGATKVELYNNINVVPAEGTVERGFNYLYINPTDKLLYLRPSGSDKPTAITNIPLYVSFEVIPYTEILKDKSEKLNYGKSRGISCNICALEDDVTIGNNEGTITPPDLDDVFYSLNVAYHFPNMVENDRLYVNRNLSSVDNYTPASANGHNAIPDFDYVPEGVENPNIEACVVKYVTDLTVSGDQLMNDSNFQLYCFIATASYGVNNGEGVVGLLCDFRDNVLLTNPLGEAFVKAYYKLSPPVAEIIAESEPLRAAVRVALKPLIVVAVNALDEDVAHQSAPWFAAFMLCGAGSVAMIIRISKGRKKAKAK